MTGGPGLTAEGYEPVRAAFESLLARRADWSGAFAAYVGGECVLDLWGGPRYRPDSLQALYSCTKGATAIVMLRLVERGLLDPEAPVSDYWPEFAAHGKGGVSVADALAHRAGVVGVPVTLRELIAHEPAAAKLAAAAPDWEPGSAHGYHALTIGVIADELARRVSGVSVGDLYEVEVRRPLGLELFLGLPEELEHRVVGGHADPEREAVSPVDHPLWRADLSGKSLCLLPPLEELPDLGEFRASALPAVSGIGSARGLARLYAAAVGDVDGVRLLEADTVSWATQPRSDGWDLILPAASTFGFVVQLARSGTADPLAGPGSFGHDGFAGSVGLGSPRLQLGVGFVSDHRPPPGGPDPAAWALVDAVVAAAADTVGAAV